VPAPAPMSLEDVNNMLTKQDREDDMRKVLQYLYSIDFKLAQLIEVWKK
jgi:hypothetical protein